MLGRGQLCTARRRGKKGSCNRLGLEGMEGCRRDEESERERESEGENDGAVPRTSSALPFGLSCVRAREAVFGVNALLAFVVVAWDT